MHVCLGLCECISAANLALGIGQQHLQQLTCTFVWACVDASVLLT